MAMIHWKTNVKKWVILVIFSYVLFAEYLVFSTAPFYWKIPVAKTENNLKVLFVSDPQLQGFEFEASGIIGYITRWDACRYLKKSFSSAMSTVNPDMVIFLGDLLDEGYIASDETFNLYKEWFEDIYQLPDRIKKIFLAGDNDVGGEDEPINDNFLKRHEKYFGPTNEIVSVNNWQFLKLNTLSFLRYYKHTPEEKIIAKNLDDFYISSIKTLNKSKHTVVLTHLPVTYWETDFAIKVMQNIKPTVFFSGNDHKSTYHIYETGGQHYTEYLVPTCSYRMGTDFMGMSVVIFEEDGSFEYSVLKLPVRFLYLYLYLIIIVVCILSLVISRWNRLSKLTSVILKRDN